MATRKVDGKQGDKNKMIPPFEIPRPPTVEYAADTDGWPLAAALAYLFKGDFKMNETLLGSIKSKMMVANGGGIAALVTFWNDPIIAALPDKAKYALLGVMIVNMVLRVYTSKPLAEKGKQEPKPELVDRLSQAVADSDRFVQAVSDVVEPMAKQSNAKFERLEAKLNKFTAALEKARKSRQPADREVS